MSVDLRGKFIANTFQNLVLMPDITKQNFCNGIGATISVINRDGIGTVKMFSPVSPKTINDYFDNATGLGIVGTDWEGWALCDNRNGTPDLRGRFIAGYSNTYTGDTSTNSQKNVTQFQTIGNVGANNTSGDTATPVLTKDQLPPHRHQTGFLFMDWNNIFASWTQHYTSKTGGQTYDGNNQIYQLNLDFASYTAQSTDGYANSGDGTDNIGAQDQLQASPNSFYPAYYVLAYVMRVS